MLINDSKSIEHRNNFYDGKISRKSKNIDYVIGLMRNDVIESYSEKRSEFLSCFFRQSHLVASV